MSDPYQQGWNAAIAAAEAIAIKWRDENRAAQQRALKSGRRRHAFDGDETQLVMADQLEGAAIECNAIAQAIRELAQPPREASAASPAAPIPASDVVEADVAGEGDRP